MSKLLKGNVVNHLTRLTLPNIGGLFAIMVMNLTDTWFVARLGTDELAAMGFTFSVVLMVGALSIGFASGASSIISRALGAGDRALARRTVSDGLVLTILVTLGVSLAGYHGIDPLFRLLGAEGHVLELIREYMQVWFLGALLVMMPPVSDDCLRADGDMVRPLLVMCICAGMNILLDPLFIFGWGPIPAMGIKGAAIATLIARACGAATSLSFLHFRSHLIDWSRPHFREVLHSWKQIIQMGVPAALTQALSPIAQGFYIRLAAGVGGTHAVAAMATGTRIEAFLFIIGFSYGIAIVPFVGQNYGARALHRVQEAFRLSTRLAFICAGSTLLILLPSAKFISGWFSADPEVVRLSTLYLIIATFGHVGLYLVSWMSQILTVTGKPRPVILINLTRVFLFVIPLCLLGSWLYGYNGLLIGLVIGNLLSGGLAYLTARHQLHQSEA